MSTNTERDLELMVGEMEAPSCESLGHVAQTEAHDDGAATHYARVTCATCDYNIVKAYCQTFVNHCTASPRTVRCCECFGPSEVTPLQAIKN